MGYDSTPMGCYEIVLEMICYFVFHLYLYFVQRTCLILPETLQVQTLLKKSKTQKYLCLVKIVYASSLPYEVKWSCILQEVYITLLPRQLKEISVLTDFDLYSFQCLVSLSLLGSSIAIRTARIKDPWFKLQGMVPVYRMHTQSL